MTDQPDRTADVFDRALGKALANGDAAKPLAPTVTRQPERTAQDDEEMFEAWQRVPTTADESAFADNCRQRNVALSFIGGVLAERARVAAICDKIEMLETHVFVDVDDEYLNASDVIELVKEIRR